ncbi:hypothetical protein [Roseisolibacter sp. H3M3-2]|uniref:hypothetical protein n=1 Tax=Roseisolibacter sp. H3M3-2 TaxID=3031323 RepID=UPI0023DA1662|nr:hypothetical protein [Roseisolibacter sp. H3M3-2]MDF1504739.1 hypothetical protein [Roseisolibacter sp. H3M3-2]
MSGLHLPPEPAAGDESTLGGYTAVHKRPAAFEGIDGLSYSVELCADDTGDGARPWGAYLLFLRWRRVGAPGIDAHLETDYVVRAADEASALAQLGRMPLLTVKATLDALIRKQEGGAPKRKWWDVMAAEDGEPAP